MQPQDQAVFLNEAAASVFTCITTGGDISGWLVNGTGYGDLPSAIREDLNSSQDLGANDVHNLTIPAKTKYNGTIVQFSTQLFGSDPVLSEIASLTLQGSQCAYTYASMSLEFRV